jgi:hypothetical protein
VKKPSLLKTLGFWGDHKSIPHTRSSLCELLKAIFSGRIHHEIKVWVISQLQIKSRAPETSKTETSRGMLEWNHPIVSERQQKIDKV